MLISSGLETPYLGGTQSLLKAFSLPRSIPAKQLASRLPETWQRGGAGPCRAVVGRPEGSGMFSGCVSFKSSRGLSGFPFSFPLGQALGSGLWNGDHGRLSVVIRDSVMD